MRNSTTSLAVARRKGKPPMAHVDAGGDKAGWALENRGALRSLVAEHAFQSRSSRIAGASPLS